MKHTLSKPLALLLALAFGLCLPAAASSETTVSTITVAATGVTTAAAAIEPEGSLRLTASVTYDGETPDSTNVTWTSSNTAVAKVTPGDPSTACAVTGVSPGKATITATAGGKTATFDVSVSGIVLSGNTVGPIYAGEKAPLTFTAYGDAAKDLTWRTESSSSAATAEVSGNTVTVTGRQADSGPVTITVKDSGGAYAAEITVPSVLSTDLAGAVSGGSFALRSVLPGIRNLNSRINGGTLSYFTGLSVNASQGTLYYGYISESDPGSGVSGTGYYPPDDRSASDFSKIYFVPRQGYSGTATITYTAYDTDGAFYHGRILVDVPLPDEEDSGITYTSIEGAAVQFSAEDLSDYCQSLNGRALNYVTFALPSAANGTLYYGSIGDGLYENSVSASTRYYRAGSPSINDVWYVPRGNSTASIRFTGMDTAANAVSGAITVVCKNFDGETSSRAEIDYIVSSGSSVYFSAADFSDACWEATGRELNYIRLTSTPGTYYGTLYNSGAAVTGTSTAYYRAASGSRSTIGALRYAAHSSRTGTVTLSFTGTDVSNETFSGTIRISIVSGSAAAIEYSVAPGGEVQFETVDFSDASYNATGRELNYIVLRSPLPASSRGGLYDSYGRVTSTGNGYYRTASGSRRLISDLGFTAAETFTGSVTVPYTGYSASGRSFYGAVTITANSSGSTSGGTFEQPIYTSSGQAVSLRTSDFTNAALERLDYELASVRFTLPSASSGRLCLNFVSPTRYGTVSASQSYPASALSRLAFLPKAGFSGTAYIGYIATDTTGKQYNGTLMLQVTPPTSSGYFNDMGGYGWAVPAVDFLRGYRIVSGTDNAGRAFTPEGLTRRGDYTLMLYNAFSFPSAGTESFPDVPADSYYARGIAAAKAAGIAAGDTDGNYRPDETITRQDAAVLLYRTMGRSGAMPSGGYADLAAFPDRGAVADYAVESMASLVKLGVFHGDEAGRLNPTALLTRAEMASLFYHAIT